MVWKIIVCVACVQAVAVGIVSAKSLRVQPRHPLPSTAEKTPLIGRIGPHDAWHPDRLHHAGRFPNTFSARHGGKGSLDGCPLCPASHEISPCACRCLNYTAAMIECGPELATCSQLTDVMSLNSYPVNTYLRLLVADTTLACNLEEALWGQLVFHEIDIINNKFQTLDNLAFQPFGATLNALNLEGNRLQNVYFSTLSDTPLLKFLTLSHNEVEFLPAYSTITLPLLEIFDASYNKIKTIRAETFAGMPKLQKIDLSNNAITKVYERAFAFPKHDASGLVIDLSNNAITSIEPGMLEGVRVCSFDLRNNYLISLPEAVYRPIIDFTAASAVFWTKNNPFDCDTQFCWIATNQTVSETFNTVLCDNLGNRTVEAITPDCLFPANTTAPRYSRSRGHPLRHASVRKAVRNLRRPSLWLP